MEVKIETDGHVPIKEMEPKDVFIGTNGHLLMRVAVSLTIAPEGYEGRIPVVDLKEGRFEYYETDHRVTPMMATITAKHRLVGTSESALPDAGGG